MLTWLGLGLGLGLTLTLALTLTKATLSLLELPDNEAALSVAIVPFRERAGEPIVVVGTAKDMTLHPRTCAAGFIHAYKFTNNNTTLELLHKTQVEDVPY